MSDQPSDEITLTLPAAPEFVRIARLTGAGLATRAGMGYDEVEDLRIAVGEACSLLIGSGQRPGTLTLTFTLAADAISVEIVGTLEGAPPTDEDTELSDQILAAVVDDHRVDAPADRVWVTKRHDTDPTPA
ncbi:ATP-binding protein [Iamia majanohamensis]|uniref:ATP-binding protein n=1 Tax=Iamia majanohamensis TaxID=467976 RepID=A0AAE9YEW9_9ACTN|nr:ATP-binding protein [Iamia majanohamensis]WCO67322.1 ATP-binding protein [Iamia majanohamensis]